MASTAGAMHGRSTLQSKECCDPVMIWCARRGAPGEACRSAKRPPRKHQITPDLVCHQCANSPKQGATGKYRSEERPHISVYGEYTYGPEQHSAERTKTPQIMNGVQGVAGSNPAVPTVRRGCPA